jgi:hypothetical protein
MIRLIGTELVLFLSPFAAYAAFLWATRKGVLHPDAWPIPVLAGLAVAALVLTAGGFALVAEFAGAPPNSTYIPAHIENGRLVPGTMR